MSVTGVASVTAVIPKRAEPPADRRQVGHRPAARGAEPRVEPVDPAGRRTGGVDLHALRELAAAGDPDRRERRGVEDPPVPGAVLHAARPGRARGRRACGGRGRRRPTRGTRRRAATRRAPARVGGAQRVGERSPSGDRRRPARDRRRAAADASRWMWWSCSPGIKAPPAASIDVLGGGAAGGDDRGDAAAVHHHVDAAPSTSASRIAMRSLMTGNGSRRARRRCRGRAAPPGRRADGPAAGRPRRPTPSSARLPSARRCGPGRRRASHRPPASRRSTTATAASSPVAGSATASAQNTGPRRSRRRAPPATAASSPKPVRTSCGGRRPWAVIESHTRRAPDGDRATASMPSWARARGRVDSITTSAVATSARRASMPARSPRSSEHRRLAGVDQVEERRRPVAGAVEASRRLDLDDVHAGLGEQLPAQRPGPQRRQVDHPEAAQRRQRCRPAPNSVAITAWRRRGVRRARPTARPSSPASRRASPAGAAAPPRRRSTTGRRRPSTPIHAGSRSRSSGRGSATANHPSAAAAGGSTRRSSPHRDG